MTDLDDALRAMLRERASDIQTLPRTVADWDAPDHVAHTRATHHRTSQWVLVAAAAVVLAVAGSVLAVRNLGHRTPRTPAASHTSTPVPATRPDAARILQWRAGIDVPAGYQLMDRALTPTSQTLALRMIDDPDATGCCGGLPRSVYVIVYGRGAFHSVAAARAGTPVTVGGRPAWSVTLPGGPFDGIVPISNDPLPSVAWEYAPGSWAVVQATTRATRELSRLLLVANAVRTGEHTTLRVPLHLSYLPPALTAASVNQNLVEVYGTTVIFTDGLSPERRTSLHIQVWQDTSPKEQGSPTTPITVDARPGTLYADGSVQVRLGTRSVVIGLDGPRASRGELMRVLAGVRWTSTIADPGTWFDATRMLG